jgi:uncharacterized membrane protein YbaN (DUF454 family)
MVDSTKDSPTAAFSTCESPSPRKQVKGPARYLWIALGGICLALGTVGVVLPFLPTVPFYLATLFCFAKGSQRLHDWFVGTNLYKKNLESFVTSRAMTMRTKLKVIGMVTVLLAIAFALMGNVPAGQVVIVAVWLFHLVYFFGRVRTATE